MADVADSVAAFLVANSGVNNLIAGRIHTDQLPQGEAKPAIAFWKENTDHTQTIGGLAGAAACRMAFECYAATRSGANALAEAIKDALMPTDESFPIRGVISGTHFLEVNIQQGQRYYAYSDGDGSDEHTYVTIQDFVFTYLE